MYDNLIFLSLRFCPKFCFQILRWNFGFSKQRSVCTFPSTLPNIIRFKNFTKTVWRAELIWDFTRENSAVVNAFIKNKSVKGPAYTRSWTSTAKLHYHLHLRKRWDDETSNFSTRRADDCADTGGTDTEISWKEVFLGETGVTVTVGVRVKCCKAILVYWSDYSRICPAIRVACTDSHGQLPNVVSLLY